MAPATEGEVLTRVEYLVDRIHKCEYDKLVYLLEIHQNEYWKMEFSSFENFCKERLGYSKQYVYRCINAAKMVEAGVPVENPNQSLALEGLDVEEAKEVWDKAEEAAAESGKKVSGGLLKKARQEKEMFERAVDGGMNIEHLSEPFKELVGILRSAKDLLHILSSTPDGQWLNYQPMAIKIRDVAESVKFAMPHSACPKCNAAGCGSCKDLGWIPKAREIASDQ
jgi:hypothetical protein|tara:strand:- start:191 stop:862 length:672 start_codon:yes stop_codon:yes gene_type:complete